MKHVLNLTGANQTEQPAYLYCTLSKTDVIIRIGVHGQLYCVHSLGRGASKRVPTRGEDCDKLNVVRGETIQELYGEYLAKVRASDHHPSECHLGFGLCEEVLPDNETSVYGRHVLERRIFVHQRPDYRKVNVRRCQLTVQGARGEISQVRMPIGLRTPKSEQHLISHILAVSVCVHTLDSDWGTHQSSPGGGR